MILMGNPHSYSLAASTYSSQYQGTTIDEEDMVIIDDFGKSYDEKDVDTMGMESKNGPGMKHAALSQAAHQNDIVGLRSANEPHTSGLGAIDHPPVRMKHETQKTTPPPITGHQDREILQQRPRERELNTTPVQNTKVRSASVDVCSTSVKAPLISNVSTQACKTVTPSSAIKSSMRFLPNQTAVPSVHPVLPTKNSRPSKGHSVMPPFPREMLSCPPPPPGVGLPPGGLASFDPYKPWPHGTIAGDELVTSHTALIPPVYAGDDKPKDRLARTSFNKKVYISFHHAGPYDLEKHGVILRVADIEVWYRWPAACDETHIKSLCKRGELESATEYLSTEIEGRPISPLNASIPRVWASHVLTTPLDDSHDCVAAKSHAYRHTAYNCDTCSNGEARKLESTSLVYIVVLSTYMDPAPEFSTRGPSPTEKVVKVLRFGSRESAAAEAFYAAGVQGWDVVFSCVLRSDALGPFGKGVGVKRVKELYELANEDDREVAGEYARVFY